MVSKEELSWLGQQCLDQHLQVDGVLHEPLDIKALFKALVDGSLSPKVPVSRTAKSFEAQGVPEGSLFFRRRLAEILAESLHVAMIQVFTSSHLVLEPADGLS